MCGPARVAIAAGWLSFACAAAPPPESSAPPAPPAAASEALLAARLPGPAGSVPGLYVVAQLDRYRATGNGGPEDRLARVEQVRSVGAVGTRLAFEWASIERRRGERSWALHDSIVAELEAAGLRVYGMIGFTPGWAKPAGTPRTHRPVVGGSAARGDTLFAAFAAAVARRYRGRVDGWEIWNEPNVPAFWIHLDGGTNLGPAAADYTTLYRLARDSIRAADPSVVIVSAGLASGQGFERSVADPLDESRRLRVRPAHDFLRRMIEAGFDPGAPAAAASGGRAVGPADDGTPGGEAVGLHPYSNVPPGVVRPGDRAPAFPDMVLDSALAVLDAAGLSDVPVWVTEWGVNESRTRSESEVERWFAAGLRELLCRPRIRVVTLYTLSDWEARQRYGLFAPDGRPAAAARALAVVRAGGFACGGG